MTRKRRSNLIIILGFVFAFVLTSAIIYFGSLTSLNAEAYTSSNLPNIVYNLTYDDYATNTSGKIFQKSVLQQLYGAFTGRATNTFDNVVSAVKNSDSSLYSPAGGTANYNIKNEDSMNFSQLKTANTANNNKPIIVKFGGFTWTVVYLTTNTNGNNGGTEGDLIATLWLSDATDKINWSGYGSDSTKTNDTYCQTIYSTSKIRVETLNGGGDNGSQYATSNTAIASKATDSSRKANKYAPFTLSQSSIGNRSLTRFLAIPRQVNYQKNETTAWSYNYASEGYAGPNEDWNGVPNLKHYNTATGRDTSTIWMAPTASNTNDFSQVTNTNIHTNYYNWTTDYLWLPSVTEMGSSSNTSLWCIPVSDVIYNNSLNVDQWTRTGSWMSALTACVVKSNGDVNTINTRTGSCAVRPALHLNLSAVERSFMIDVPSDVTKTYNGYPQGIDSESWYTGDLKNAINAPVYYNLKDSSSSTTKPTNAGNYQVELTIKSDSDKVWSTGSSSNKSRRISFTINKAQIDFPQFEPNGDKKPYSGDSPVYFQLLTFDDNIITVTPTNGANFDVYSQRVSATAVGVYNMNVSLNDTVNYEWISDDNPLACEIIKAPVHLTIDDGSGGKTLSGAAGSTVSAFIEVDQSFRVHDGKAVMVNIIAKKVGVARGPKIGSIVIDGSTTRTKINLDLTGLDENSTYILSAVADTAMGSGSDLYEITETDTVSLNVLNASMRLTWRLKEDGNIVSSQMSYSGLTEYTKIFDGADIFYSGKAYAFEASAPQGYTLDKDFGVNGYRVNHTNNLNNNVGVNVDKYSTEVQLISSAGTQIYSISWEIKVALFDLSNVRWIYDGQLPYTPGGISAKLDDSTLPAGLVPSYGGANFDGISVGDRGDITVAFTLSSGYEGNYKKPKDGDTTSYLFTPSGSLTDFEWNKHWEVVPAVIPINWVDANKTDSNGITFTYKAIDGSQYANVLKYHFYETDSSGQLLSSDPNDYLDLNQVVVPENARKFYKVKPVFANSTHANNYTLQDVFSIHFAIGEFSEAVEIDLQSKLLTYNGNPQNVIIDILQGTIGVNQFDIVYYDRGGVNPISAPTNVGSYTAQITIRSGVSGYYLTGDNVTDSTATIDFEIVKRVIDNSQSKWVTSHNPPSLQLSRADIAEVLYEYQDSDGNPITFAQISAGNTYKVRARIRDFNNCEFGTATTDGDIANTDWVEFTVSENETLYDPLDPSNPFYPENPDNPSDPGADPGTTPGTDPGNNGDNGASFLDKIKEFIDSGFPLWQIATMAVAGLLTLIFLIKAMQYGSRAKKAKGEAKKLSAKTFALMPIFSTEVVLAGLTNQIWSIMAFSLAGAALLMFVIALVMRRSWKKAELAKETAAEDLETRKSEAEKQERREFQERLTANQIGSDGSLEEILRQRDEEHRQEMEAMKMMLANLMGRSQGVDSEPIYGSVDDTELLVQKVIAGLLPAVQQMLPDTTAYLTAPGYEESEQLKNLVEEQSDQIRSMSEQIASLQEQLADIHDNRVEAVLLPDQSEEMQALTEQIADLQNQLIAITQDRVEGVLLPDESEQIKALTDQITDLQNQLITMSQQRVAQSNQSEEIKALTDKIDELQEQLASSKAETPDNSDEIKALTAEVLAMRKEMSTMSQGNTTVYVEKESDDDSDDDEEEWDSVLDEEDDDFVEAVIIEEDGTVKKTSPNFRMRLKQSSDKNREWYTVIKNMFCSQKGVTYRVYKRVEKLRYQGQVIGVIGIAKRSIKLWLALKPYEYDARRYHHKDVSDKPRFVDVPMYVRVGSDRALLRAQELILALFQELNMEERKRYNDRSIQELIFTLKHNRLLANKQTKQLLCEVMHVHDCDDVLDDETAEKCVEYKNVDYIDDSLITTVKLDDIDAYFQDGNRVTLEKLKKAGLISEECTGYNVVADKRLTKPLIIVANDFSITAIKLIALTGGRAIKLQTV